MSKDDSPSPYAEPQWQRWNMAPFDFAPDDPNAPEPTQEEVDAAALLAEIEELKQLALKQAKAEGYAAGHQQGLEAGKEEGLKSGYEEGLAAGLKKGEDEGYKSSYEKGSKQSAAEAARLAELTTRSGKALHSLHEDMGQALLALAVDIAQHVLQTELKQYPEQLLPLVKEVLQEVDSSDQTVTLLLNPDDLPLVEQHLADDLAHNTWRLKADPTISAGGVEVQSSLGHVDATLETRWRRVLARLGPAVAAADKNTM